MYKVDPKRLDLLDEFRKAPFGPHSQELRNLVIALRMGPVQGKYVLFESASKGTWQLGQLSNERYGPVQMLTQTFTDLGEAEWYVFRLRWEARTGCSLENL